MKSYKYPFAGVVGAACLIWAAAGMAQSQTVYSDDGLSEIRVASHWLVNPHVGQTAALRVVDNTQDVSLVVNTYLPDGSPLPSLASSAKTLNQQIVQALDEGQISAPRTLTIQGRPAIEYEISGRVGDIRLRYLSTVVNGPSARHHLIGWTLAERYKAQRAPLRAVMATFRESPKQRPTRERVDLHFDWTGIQTSTVDFRSKQTKRGISSEMQGKGRTQIKPLADAQLLIRTEVTDYSHTSTDGDEAKSAYMQNLMREAMSGIPDYVVAADGSFVRLDQVGEYVARIEQSLLKGLPGDAEALRPKVKQLIQSLVSEASLTQSIQDQWNNHVANWAGGSYAMGERYVFAAQYQAAALGAAAFPMTITQRLLGRVPCNDQDQAQSCVQLEQVSRVTDPAFRKAMHGFINKMVNDMAPDSARPETLSVERAEIQVTVNLVTEPGSLRPHNMQTSKTTTVVLATQDLSKTSQDIEESTTRYTY